MTEVESSFRPRCSISFKTSSTRGGQPAYDLTVENGVSEDEVMETLRLAILARQACEKEVEPPTLVEQLEVSLRHENS
jgi:hypothetical protein